MSMRRSRFEIMTAVFAVTAELSAGPMRSTFTIVSRSGRKARENSFKTFVQRMLIWCGILDGSVRHLLLLQSACCKFHKLGQPLPAVIILQPLPVLIVIKFFVFLAAVDSTRRPARGSTSEIRMLIEQLHPRTESAPLEQPLHGLLFLRTYKRRRRSRPACLAKTRWASRRRGRSS
jgi:hypothetical protein